MLSHLKNNWNSFLEHHLCVRRIKSILIIPLNVVVSVFKFQAIGAAIFICNKGKLDIINSEFINNTSAVKYCILLASWQMFAQPIKGWLERPELIEAAGQVVGGAASLAHWRHLRLRLRLWPGPGTRVTCELRPNAPCQVTMRTFSVLIVTGSYQYPCERWVLVPSYLIIINEKKCVLSKSLRCNLFHRVLNWHGAPCTDHVIIITMFSLSGSWSISPPP